METADKIAKGPIIGANHGEVQVTNSFRIMLQVKSFSSAKVSSDDVDLIISVYEVEEGNLKAPKPVCESYVIENWKKTSAARDTNGGCRVLFDGICKNDITKKSLYLICNVVAQGNYTKHRTDVSSNENLGNIFFRKPAGVAARDITEIFTFRQNGHIKGDDTELFCPFLAGDEKECLETTFRKLVSDKNAKVEPKGLHCQISIIFGDVALDNNYGVRVPEAKKLGLPEIILPSDVRNDLYVKIDSGEFSRLEKMQDRNTELQMDVCDENGHRVRDAIFLGVGVEPKDSFKSVVYYHHAKPRWNEVVKITLPADQFQKCHLRFTFTHRSRKDENVPPYAMSFLKLVHDHDETAIKDDTYEMIVYKIEKRVEVQNANFYLSMPYLKRGSTFKVVTHFY